LFLSSLLCASCLTMTLPKNARVETAPPGPAIESKTPPRDNPLIDNWELMYQVNEKGEEKRPLANTRTWIKFAPSGQVKIDKLDKEQSGEVMSRSGAYAINRDEITITDDAGNTVKWPFQITGDVLVIDMPELKMKFYWRRSKQ
jgi:hypothetical protein